MNAQMLTDITRGMHHAVNTTGTMISQQYVMLLQQFFGTQEDGSIAAKMVKVQMDEKHDILVPLIPWCNPRGSPWKRCVLSFPSRLRRVN